MGTILIVIGMTWLGIKSTTFKSQDGHYSTKLVGGLVSDLGDTSASFATSEKAGLPSGDAGASRGSKYWIFYLFWGLLCVKRLSVPKQKF